MKKIRCLITAGPTREYFDPVRFVSNPSTGKMGWAIANAAKDIGWDTILVLGPSALPDIDGAETVRVVSAQDMFEACKRHFDSCDILIMSAAVSDVRPKFRLPNKAKKDAIDLRPELERTPDILLELSKIKKNNAVSLSECYTKWFFIRYSVYFLPAFVLHYLQCLIKRIVLKYKCLSVYICVYAFLSIKRRFFESVNTK